MRWSRRFRRRAARVVLLDPTGRVLLLRHEPEPGEDARGYWYLPGGGVMPFEATRAAARRELREETGISDLALGPVIGERPDVSFVFRRRRIVQDEWYVAASVPSSHVGSGRRGDGEQRAVAAHRWWALDELTASGELVFPPALDQLIRAASAWAASQAGAEPLHEATARGDASRG